MGLSDIFKFDNEATYKPFPGLETLESNGLVDEFEAVGSRVTCDPAPQDTDE